MKKAQLLVITSFAIALVLNYGFISSAHASDQEFVLRQIGHIPAEGRTDAVQVVGKTAYILDFEEELLIYDVSELAHPTLLGSYEANNWINPAVKGGHSFLIRGDYAIVGFQHGGLKIIDISDPANLEIVGTYYGGTDTYHIAVVDDLVYLIMEYDGLNVIDISDITHPTKVGQFVNGNPLYHIHASGNIVYAFDSEQDKFLCLNATDLSNITEIVQFEWFATDIEVVNKTGYMAADSEGVMIYDFSDPAKPIFLGLHYDGGAAADLNIIGNLAFIADGKDGLEIIDITNPENPVEIAQFNDGGTSTNVFVEGNVAYVAEREDGLEIIGLRAENNDDQISGFKQYSVLISLLTVLMIRKRKK
ncbi:MAG: LVIVD repeat-containing protein [Candidatus Heimdallarchaeota archaeon]